MHLGKADNENIQMNDHMRSKAVKRPLSRTSMLQVKWTLSESGNLKAVMLVKAIVVAPVAPVSNVFLHWPISLRLLKQSTIVFIPD